MQLKKAANLEELYTSSSDDVRRHSYDANSARESYVRYVEYLNHFADLSDKTVLDVGCGNGWSSYFLAEHAEKVTGLDLHKNAFEPKTNDKLSYKQSSATNIDFGDGTFDVVTTHECLEHVPNPQKALNEFDRVLKPGGYVFIVGPNLFSGLQSVRGLTSYVWKKRSLHSILFRNASMPRHPHGNTLPEIVYYGFLNFLSTIKLATNRKPLFKLREPDLTPPFHADNDACYYLNPLDLKYFFESKGYEILNISGVGRPKSLAMVSSGTWFAARKPSN